jgi:hypothetical protein
MSSKCLSKQETQLAPGGSATRPPITGRLGALSCKVSPCPALVLPDTVLDDSTGPGQDPAKDRVQGRNILSYTVK